ncbi:bifunctional DNA primase/polymerase [Chloroflexota bacterium]
MEGGEMQNLDALIERYRNEGLSFIPIPYKSKVPAIEWKQFQQKRPDDSQVEGWFNGRHTNLAVICGSVSGGLVVLDFDSEERFWKFDGVSSEKTGIEIFDFTRVSKTARGFHVWLRIQELVKNQKYPDLDIKSDGGYIIAPPSVHPDGAKYELLNPDIPIRKVKSLSEIGIDVTAKPQAKREKTNNEPYWVTRALAGVEDGERGDIAIKLAGYFRNLMPIEVTTSLLVDWNLKNRPPMEEARILKTVESAYKYPEHKPMANSIYTLYNNCPNGQAVDTARDKSVTENVTTNRQNQDDVTHSLAKRIEEFFRDSSGWVSVDQIDREFEIKTATEKTNRRKIIQRLKVSATIECHQRDNKLYRFINTRVRLIDFKAATPKTPLAVKYPFNIERYFNTYPGNIIALAGAADSGKTAMLLNFIQLNQFDFHIYYQSSEMGKEELASRLTKFEGIKLEEWNFTAEERSKDFADVIRPDAINIIDYMELSSDFYAVAEYLRQIHDKLGSGICLVALQKKRNAELGRGGDFGLEKPRLYLSMDAGKCTIQKAKNWVNHEVNPNGLVINFKIVGGCRFLITNDWHMEGLK